MLSEDGLTMNERGSRTETQCGVLEGGGCYWKGQGLSGALECVRSLCLRRAPL